MKRLHAVDAPAAPKQKSLDLQDVLLLVGVGSLVGGIGAWSRPAGFVVFGLICLATVFLMQRTKPVEKGVKNGSAGE